jgi:hypothetical protein
LILYELVKLSQRRAHGCDENLRALRQQGKKKWKQESHDQQRSLAETSVFRNKAICGKKRQTRRLENQFKEMFIKCARLNRLTHLGMPDSYQVSN